MSAQRERVRALVRRELEKRLPASGPPARRQGRSSATRAVALTLEAVLAEIYQGPECNEDPDLPERRSCVIEPDRPCTNTGYCKKLGY